MSARPAASHPPGADSPPPEGSPPPDEVEALRRELSAVRAREAELRKLLAQAHEQLAQRDEEIVQEIVHRSQVAQRQLQDMRRTRVWRAATLYWGVREQLSRRLGVLRRRA